MENEDGAKEVDGANEDDGAKEVDGENEVEEGIEVLNKVFCVNRLDDAIIGGGANAVGCANACGARGTNEVGWANTVVGTNEVGWANEVVGTKADDGTSFNESGKSI